MIQFSEYDVSYMYKGAARSACWRACERASGAGRGRAGVRSERETTIRTRWVVGCIRF